MNEQEHEPVNGHELADYVYVDECLTEEQWEALVELYRVIQDFTEALVRLYCVIRKAVMDFISYIADILDIIRKEPDANPPWQWAKAPVAAPPPRHARRPAVFRGFMPHTHWREGRRRA